MLRVAVMPCYKSSKIAPLIAKDVINYVDKLICVDDSCPEYTGQKIANALDNEKLMLFFMKIIRVLGERWRVAFYTSKFNPEIIIKIDSDGQMDPALIPELIEPLLKDLLSLVKGIDSLIQILLKCHF